MSDMDEDMNMNETNKPFVLPEEFTKVMRNFVSDMKTTFPEFVPLINKWWSVRKGSDNLEEPEGTEEELKRLFNFCAKKYPVSFFNILYQKDEIFEEDSNVDTEFLPNIHFKNLWHFDISDNTRSVLWKYLQLVLFSVTGALKNTPDFSDSDKMFEAMKDSDFNIKLQDSIKQIQEMFSNMNMDTSETDTSKTDTSETDTNTSDSNNTESNTKRDQQNTQSPFPDANDINGHIHSLLDGKLGRLAREIAEETAGQLNSDMQNITDMKDVFSNLLGNPTKLMGLVKNVGEKLDNKMKSGEMKQSEMFEEATNILNSMKNMPGMDNIHKMMGEMGMNIPGLDGKTKLNMNAMESTLKRNTHMAKMKERMKSNIEKKNMEKLQQLQQLQQQQQQQQPLLTDDQLADLFADVNVPLKTNTNTKTSSKKGKSKK
jgi:hypothetical protein